MHRPIPLPAFLLAAIPSVRPARAPCPQLEPLTDPTGRPVGYVCPAFLDTARAALVRSAP
jgi:hypothetical protein